ncbi:YkgJ family cysteine cluster protein [uncultured Robinsoniella sp.]|uniref:YkgJ family cysteine cluster protein n=1 Tax=uncultured Robinsoniella sp. TaxID=904190 RepID=UPI00374ECA8B
MIREVNLQEISDGKLYGLNDMVKADCQDCNGCSACCQGMGDSIILDPLDIYRLTTNLNCSFEELLKDKVTLNIVDNMILPNLKMDGGSERCTFLNKEGRCTIHSFRPGICRIFPLGRFYENHSFQYFLQIHECKKDNRTKIKVRKWIDTPDAKNYEQFIVEWHYFLKDMQKMLEREQNEHLMKEVGMYILKYFYLMPYETDREFYGQFRERLNTAGEFVKTL